MKFVFIFYPEISIFLFTLKRIEYDANLWKSLKQIVHFILPKNQIFVKKAMHNHYQLNLNTQRGLQDLQGLGRNCHSLFSLVIFHCDFMAI